MNLATLKELRDQGFIDLRNGHNKEFMKWALTSGKPLEFFRTMKTVFDNRISIFDFDVAMEHDRRDVAEFLVEDDDLEERRCAGRDTLLRAVKNGDKALIEWLNDNNYVEPYRTMNAIISDGSDLFEWAVEKGYKANYGAGDSLVYQKKFKRLEELIALGDVIEGPIFRNAPRSAVHGDRLDTLEWLYAHRDLGEFIRTACNGPTYMYTTKQKTMEWLYAHKDWPELVDTFEGTPAPRPISAWELGKKWFYPYEGNYKSNFKWLWDRPDLFGYPDGVPDEFIVELIAEADTDVLPILYDIGLDHDRIIDAALQSKAYMRPLKKLKKSGFKFTKKHHEMAMTYARLARAAWKTTKGKCCDIHNTQPPDERALIECAEYMLGQAH